MKVKNTTATTIDKINTISTIPTLPNNKLDSHVATRNITLNSNTKPITISIENRAERANLFQSITLILPVNH